MRGELQSCLWTLWPIEREELLVSNRSRTVASTYDRVGLKNRDTASKLEPRGLRRSHRICSCAASTSGRPRARDVQSIGEVFPTRVTIRRTEQSRRIKPSSLGSDRLNPIVAQTVVRVGWGAIEGRRVYIGVTTHLITNDGLFHGCKVLQRSKE